MRPIDIAPADLETVRCILREHAPGLEVRAFGSRVSFTARETSDLDLALLTEETLSIARMTNLKATFTKSYLPFRVDIVDWASASEKFRKVIEREHVVLVERNSASKFRASKTKHLGDCVTINDSTYSPKEEYPFINYLDTGNITSNRISEIQFLHVGSDVVPSRARRKVQPGDIVYSTVRPIQRHYGLLKEVPENFLVSTGFCVIRGNPRIAETDFIYWFLTQNSVIEQLNTIAEQSTSAYPSIKPADIEKLGIELPPLTEQRAIAHILGTLDDKIELNRRMNKTLEEMAQALFKSWFVDFEPVKAKLAVLEKGGSTDEAERAAMRTISCKDEITLAKLENDESEVFVNLARTAAQFPSAMQDSELGQIPEGWGIKPLDEVANFQNGLALQKFRPQNQEDRLPVVKIAQLRSGKTDSEEWSTANIRPECIIDDGDVIFSWSGSLMVKMWVGGSAALNQHLFKVTSINYPKWFYFYCVLSHLRDFQSIAAGKATTMGHIKRQHLSDALCVVPDINYLASVESFFAPILAAYVSTEIANRTLSTLRDSLLPKLISGELQTKQQSEHEATKNSK